jgi:trigger factor
MTSALITKGNGEAKFTMTFTAEEFDEATAAAYRATKGRYRVDGFRQGKAPRSIIEKWYGEGVFFEDAIDTLLNTNYPKALDELDIEPIDRPDVKFGEGKIEKGKGFEVTITVAIAPDVELSQYKGLKVEKVVYPVTDEDVERELTRVQKQNARLVSKDGAAEDGDTVILDYAGFSEGKQFEGGTAESQSLKLGSGTFIPGFEEQLVGLKAGDEKDVELSFPEYYHEKSLAGKPATFKCKIHEVKKEELPALDDEFAKDVSEFDTLEEYKNDIRRIQSENSGKAAEYDGKNKAIEQLVAANPVSIPAVMINDEARNMLNEFAQQLAMQGMDVKEYAKLLKKTENELADEFKPQAESRLKSRLLLDAVAKAENMEVSEEELTREFDDLAKQYRTEAAKLREMFEKDGNIKYLKQDILNRRAIDFIYDNAEVTEVAPKVHDAEVTEVKADEE